MLAAALFAAAVYPSFAKDRPDGQQLLDTSRKPSDLFQSKAEPFDLEVDFAAQLNVPTQGHLSMKWRAKNQWRFKVAVGAFEQITVRNEEMEYTLRNAGFTPLAVQDLLHLLRLRDPVDAFIVENQKDRTENGVTLICVKAHIQGSREDAHNICIDSSSNNQLSDEWKFGLDEKRTERFADYFDFDGTSYPRKLQLFKDASKAVAANVIELKTVAFDPKLLTPPVGAIERRHCPEVKAPLPISTPQPSMKTPPRYTGETTIALTILTDGTVGDAQLISRGGNIIDEPTLAALKKWKFKPAMCGSEPIVADIEMTFGVRPW